MQRRQLFKLSLLAAATAASQAVPAMAIAASAKHRSKTAPVPDARLTHPLPVPSNGEIKVAFLISPDAELVDFAGPWGVFDYVLIGEGGRKPFKLYTVAVSKTPIVVSGGMTIVPNYDFNDAPAPDVVVVPAMDTAQLAPAALDWLRAVQTHATLTMSVCNGAYVLAEAGLLNGKRAAAHHSSIGMLRALHPQVTVLRGLRYVEDGKIASSGGLTSGIDLALRVVERYYGRAVAEQTVSNLEYQGSGWKHPTSNAAFARKPVLRNGQALCPVCEGVISKKTDLREVFDHKTYYFCSDWCRSRFKANPKVFTSRT